LSEQNQEQNVKTVSAGALATSYLEDGPVGPAAGDLAYELQP
jgi:hypothetical protein